MWVWAHRSHTRTHSTRWVRYFPFTYTWLTFLSHTRTSNGFLPGGTRVMGTHCQHVFKSYSILHAMTFYSCVIEIPQTKEILNVCLLGSSPKKKACDQLIIPTYLTLEHVMKCHSILVQSKHVECYITRNCLY
jgi:hypothetical protein